MTGPYCWENWRAARDGVPERFSVEVALYTDHPQVIGEFTGHAGPYQLLNTIPMHTPGVAPAIVARVSHHDLPTTPPIAPSPPPVTPRDFPTVVGTWHGGDLYDELAALVSLRLGIPCRSGGVVRVWDANSDPKGRPIEWERHPRDRPNISHPVIPAPPKANLELLGPIFDCLWRITDEEDAVRAIRAARAYQEGLWIADSDPSEAWVRLVGAVEVAASKAARRDPWETLSELWPAMAAALRQIPEEQAIPLVRQLAHERRAQKRFVDFLIRFDPGPPADRPAFGAAQVDWGAMHSHLGTIYNYRSRALHDGRPFPWPMCEPPAPIDGHLAERPYGLAFESGSTRWNAEDVPMLLATFERVVRNALNAWIDSLATTAGSQAGG